MDGWQWHMDGAPDEWGDDSAPPVGDARTELGSASSFTSATSGSDSADSDGPNHASAAAASAAAAAPLEPFDDGGGDGGGYQSDSSANSLLSYDGSGGYHSGSSASGTLPYDDGDYFSDSSGSGSLSPDGGDYFSDGSSSGGYLADSSSLPPSHDGGDYFSDSGSAATSLGWEGGKGPPLQQLHHPPPTDPYSRHGDGLSQAVVAAVPLRSEGMHIVANAVATMPGDMHALAQQPAAAKPPAAAQEPAAAHPKAPPQPKAPSAAQQTAQPKASSAAQQAAPSVPQPAAQPKSKLCPHCDRACEPNTPHRLGVYWQKFGYSGPQYCSRCASVFRAHTINRTVQAKTCQRERPCHVCHAIMSNIDRDRAELFVELDAAADPRPPSRAAAPSRQKKQPQQTCPICSESSSQMGQYWKKFGYSGPPYCSGCSSEFRNHIIRQRRPRNVSCTRGKPCDKCEAILSCCTGDRATVFSRMVGNTLKQPDSAVESGAKRAGPVLLDVKSDDGGQTQKPSSPNKRQRGQQGALLLGGLAAIACIVGWLSSFQLAASPPPPVAGGSGIPSSQPSDVEKSPCSAVDEIYYGRLGHRLANSLDTCANSASALCNPADAACVDTCDYRCEANYEPFGEMRCVPDIHRYAGGMCRPAASLVDSALNATAEAETQPLAEQSWREELAFVAAQSCASTVPPAGSAGNAFLDGSWGPGIFEKGRAVPRRRAGAAETEAKAKAKAAAAAAAAPYVQMPRPAYHVSDRVYTAAGRQILMDAREHQSLRCYCKSLDPGDPSMNIDSQRVDGALSVKDLPFQAGSQANLVRSAGQPGGRSYSGLRGDTVNMCKPVSECVGLTDRSGIENYQANNISPHEAAQLFLRACSPWHDPDSVKLLQEQLRSHTMTTLMQWSAAANVSETVVAITMLDASGVPLASIQRQAQDGDVDQLLAMARALARQVDAHPQEVQRQFEVSTGGEMEFYARAKAALVDLLVGPVVTGRYNANGQLGTAGDWEALDPTDIGLDKTRETTASSSGSNSQRTR